MTTAPRTSLCKRESDYCFSNKDGIVCVNKCDPILYYQSELKNECVKCHPTCSGCLGPQQNHCLKCKNKKQYLEDGKCVSECTPKHYLLESTCKPCQYNCTTCVESPARCTGCIDGLYLDGNKCKEACPKQYLRDATKNECVKECLPGYYSNQTDCVQCPKSCVTCSPKGKAYKCTQCQKGYFAFNSLCYEKCPAMFYANLEKMVCQSYLSVEARQKLFQKGYIYKDENQDQRIGQKRYFQMRFTDTVVSTLEEVRSTLKFEVKGEDNLLYNITSYYDGRYMDFYLILNEFHGFLKLKVIANKNNLVGYNSKSPLNPLS